MFDWITDLIDGIGESITTGLSDVWNTVTSTIWDVFLKWVYEAVFSAIGDFFTMMAGMGTQLFDLPWIQSFLKLFSLFGWALFVAGLVIAVFDTAIEYQSMRQINIKTQILPIIYSFLAVSLFTTVPIRLYNFCITIQNVFSHDLSGVMAGHMAANNNIGAFAYDVLLLLTPTPTINLLDLFFLIALGYCVIKIFFQNIKRGGILLIQIAVGSLYMFGMPKGHMDGFYTWCKQVAALCLTAFLQMTLMFLGLLTWQTNVLLGLGVMLSANEVPRIAQNFGLDTGMKVNIMQAVHTTTSVVNLTKAIAKGAA